MSRQCSEAAKACLEFGVEKLGMKRIVASMEVNHHASKSVAEKIGLKFEREFINKRNRDLLTTLLSYEVSY
jgi:ribosomal-protein-alanine N-acetyltransferase